MKNKLNIAVIGSRNFKNFELLNSVLNSENINCIISGGAEGADTLAELYATNNKINTIIYKPEYSKYGKIAPIIRNSVIVKKADKIIAFWDGSSKGTANAIKTAGNIGKDVLIIRY